MNDSNIIDIPDLNSRILTKSKEIGYAIASDLFIGSLLKTLISSKPSGKFVELGTGIGLSLSWAIDDMLPQPNWQGVMMKMRRI